MSWVLIVAVSLKLATVASALDAQGRGCEQG
jgi:hypothetical protein